MELVGWFLDFNVPSVAWRQFRTNHALKFFCTGILINSERVIHRLVFYSLTCVLKHKSVNHTFKIHLHRFNLKVTESHVPNSSTPVQTTSQ